MEAIRGMTIEEIIEHLKSISDALREGFDACGRLIKENPNNRLVRVAMEGMQNLCASVALELYATFGIDSRVGGWHGWPGDNIAGHRTPPRDKRWELPCGVYLVPCGFCGRQGASLGLIKNDFGDFSVECDCGARGPSGITPRRAVEAWNELKRRCR